jgi:16S rRNA (uracil1498-N3)-methyltransferase
MGLFLISGEPISGDRIVLEKAESHHLIRVLRKKVGDIVSLTNGRGTYYKSRILHAEEPVTLEIFSLTKNPATSSPEIFLCPALLKNPRMDWLIEKATELGADALLPYLADRGVVRVKSESEKANKIRRWERIAKAALKQSGGDTLPRIGPLLAWRELTERFGKVKALKLLFTPEEDENPSLKELEETIAKKENLPLWIAVIGPEGGFTHRETALAKEAGFLFGSLGAVTLRAETAALTALSILSYWRSKIIP